MELGKRGLTSGQWQNCGKKKKSKQHPDLTVKVHMEEKDRSVQETGL